MTAENNNNTSKPSPAIKLTEKQRSELIKNMKIAYYRVFYKQGLITAEQLEKLIDLQHTIKSEPAA